VRSTTFLLIVLAIAGNGCSSARTVYVDADVQVASKCHVTFLLENSPSTHLPEEGPQD
jgi:hypothetical protein